MAGSEARIGQPNIMICKSVMHIVDAVLLPAPIAELAAGKVGFDMPEVSALYSIQMRARPDMQPQALRTRGSMPPDAGWVRQHTWRTLDQMHCDMT